MFTGFGWIENQRSKFESFLIATIESGSMTLINWQGGGGGGGGGGTTLELLQYFYRNDIS